MDDEDRRSPSRWHSIEVRLPLLIAVLLTLAVWAEGCPGEGATFYFSLPAGGAGGRPSGSEGA